MGKHKDYLKLQPNPVQFNSKQLYESHKRPLVILPRGGPERRQQGGTQGHGQRDVNGRGSITQSCVATLEGGGVSGAQKDPSQRLCTRLLLQASTGVEGEDVCSIEPLGGENILKTLDQMMQNYRKSGLYGQKCAIQTVYKVAV